MLSIYDSQDWGTAVRTDIFGRLSKFEVLTGTKASKALQ